MGPLLAALDALLRGRFTSPEELSRGRVAMPSHRLVAASLLCGALYGVCMGVYAASSGLEDSALQLLSSALKVPLLFLLTLAVTLPSLYVFGALAGSRLHLADTLRLLVAAVAVNLAVLASFGPITVFFTVFTRSYAFIAALNVAFFALAGFVSLGFLARAVRLVFGSESQPAQAGAGASAGEGRRPAERGERRARTIFRVWLVIYGIVGAQMGWILRPFVGNPSMPFTWFRHHRESNFFAALVDIARDLLGR